MAARKSNNVDEKPSLGLILDRCVTHEPVSNEQREGSPNVARSTGKVINTNAENEKDFND